MKYHEKLITVTEFVQDNFYDVSDLVTVLGLSVEDVIKYLPDVLVANYSKFFTENDYTKEEETEDYKEYSRLGDAWQNEEEGDY